MIKKQNNVFVLLKNSIGQENNASHASIPDILIAKSEIVYYVQTIKFMMLVKKTVKIVLHKCLSSTGRNVCLVKKGSFMTTCQDLAKLVPWEESMMK